MPVFAACGPFGCIGKPEAVVWCHPDARKRPERKEDRKMFPLERLSCWFFRLWHLSPHEFWWLAKSWWRNRGKVVARCKVCGVVDWWPPAVPPERRACFGCFSSIDLERP
jgi:hypothetical protein